jgi:hypothetical protein
MCNFFLVGKKRNCLKKAISGMQNCRIHSKSEPPDVGDCGKNGCRHLTKTGRFCKLKARVGSFCKRHTISEEIVSETESVHGESGENGCHFMIKSERFCKLESDVNGLCKRHKSKKVITLMENVSGHREEDEKFDDCCICYERLCVKDLPLSCGHVVHMDCQISSGQDRCPLCRATLRLSKSVMNKISKCKRKLNLSQVS